MRQAIVTRYLNPTNRAGARVKAICDAKTLTISWDHALNPAQNHERAALILADKLGWLARNTVHAGALPEICRDSFVFVLEPKN